MSGHEFVDTNISLYALVDPARPSLGPIMNVQTQTFSNVFDALADTPQEAANLRARAELARALAALVAANSWTQAEAARRCGLTQPRMNDLLRGRISRFSLDALVNMAVGCGQRVRVALEAAA